MPYFLDEPAIQKLRIDLVELRAQIASAKERLGPQHPTMRGLVEHENELKTQLRSEVRNELESVRTKLGAARLREQRLRTRLSALEDSAVSIRELGARYDVLKTNLQTARTLHDSLLKQQLDTAVNSDLALTNVRIVETPEVARIPSQPWVLVDLLLGIIASALVALGAVFARTYFDSSVATSEEVEEFLQLPTLAAIPNFALAGLATGNGVSADGGLAAGEEDSEVVVLREPWSQIAEAFRMMKTAVLFSASGVRTTPKVVLVTSALPGEGKTIGSLNLAAALAEAGARVLLIDADLRHARCHTALGVSNERGLSALLMGKASPEDVVQRLKTPRLSFVPAGRRPANPAELVSAGELHAAFTKWRTAFNFVVVDTPPALTASDAVELAQYADGVVLVVKGDDTPRALVRRVRNKLTRAGAQVLGVVLNNVGRSSHDFYYYGDETDMASSHQGRSA
jgi:capsular exopolysaccharide synthesis family protein